MLRLGIGLGQESSEKAAIARIVCSNPDYTSDFSVNADSWTGDTGISAIIGNRDAIGGLNDNLGVRFAVGIPIITRTLAAEVSAGCSYTYSLSVFIPTGNKDVTYISKLLIGGEEIIISTGAITSNIWTLFTGTFTASETLTSFGIEFNAGSASSELVYLREITLSLL